MENKLKYKRLYSNLVITIGIPTGLLLVNFLINIFWGFWIFNFIQSMLIVLLYSILSYIEIKFIKMAIRLNKEGL